MPTVIENGRNGITDTNPDRLIDGALELLGDRELARRLGHAGRELARERFSMERFTRDWDRAFRDVVGRRVRSGSRDPQPVAGVAV
jgi:glycosyltransferase involved in cell wall biosynthesis